MKQACRKNKQAYLHNALVLRLLPRSSASWKPVEALTTNQTSLHISITWLLAGQAQTAVLSGHLTCNMGDSTASDCILYSVWPLRPVTRRQSRAKSQRCRRPSAFSPSGCRQSRHQSSNSSVQWGLSSEALCTPSRLQHLPSRIATAWESSFQGDVPISDNCEKTLMPALATAVSGLDPLSCSRWPGLGSWSK